MSEKNYVREFTSLTERPPVLLDEAQLALLAPEHLFIREAQDFDVVLSAQKLINKEGGTFVGIDMGGDKISAQSYVIQGGLARQSEGISLLHKSNGGHGYLEVLEAAADFATQQNTGVGVSYAGPVDGTKPISGPNVDIFLGKLREKYDGDFARVLPTLSTLGNDAVSGLTEAAVQLHATHPNIESVIYLINGSGLGGAVLTDGKIFATEVGHAEVVPQFNPYGQDKECGLNGATFTCIERVAASKAGIEDIWQSQTGEAADGKAIEDQYKAGNELAAALYENSTILSAHAVIGLARAFNLDLNTAAVVGHGGAFRFPGYADRMQQHIQHSLNQAPLISTTYSFSENACLDGAATMAALR